MNKKFILSCMAIGILAGLGFSNVLLAAERPYHEIEEPGGNGLVLDEDSIYGLVDHNSVSDEWSLVIPEQYSVIRSDAFLDFYDLTSVTIPNSITSIDGIEHMRNTKFKVYSEVMKNFLIHKFHLRDCNIEVMPSESEPWAWKNNGEIEIPNTIAYIDKNTFKGRSDIRSIIMQDGMLAIGDDAFYGFKNLREVVLPNSVKYIGNSAFSGCISLASVILPNSLRCVSHNAFYNCANLERLIIPNGIINIGLTSFYGCNNLKEVTIPASVLSIEESAFGISKPNICARKFYVPCDAMKNYLVQFHGIDKYGAQCEVYDSGVNNLWGWPINGIVKIPNDVNRISDHMFTNRKDIKKVTLHSNVRSIGEFAFAYCENMADLEMQDGIESVGAFSFAGCKSLSKVVLPSTVKHIGGGAFTTSKVNEITIPKGLESAEEFSLFSLRLNTINVSCLDGVASDDDRERILKLLNRKYVVDNIDDIEIKFINANGDVI